MARCQRASSAQASSQTWNWIRSMLLQARGSSGSSRSYRRMWSGGKSSFERVLAARGPLEVLRRNLGGDVEPLVGWRADELAEQSLAVAVAVGPGRVEEVAAQLHRALEGRMYSSSSEPSSRPCPTCRSRPHPLANPSVRTSVFCIDVTSPGLNGVLIPSLSRGATSIAGSQAQKVSSSSGSQDTESSIVHLTRH